MEVGLEDYAEEVVLEQRKEEMEVVQIELELMQVAQVDMELVEVVQVEVELVEEILIPILIEVKHLLLTTSLTVVVDTEGTLEVQAVDTAGMVGKAGILEDIESKGMLEAVAVADTEDMLEVLAVDTADMADLLGVQAVDTVALVVETQVEGNTYRCIHEFC